MSATDGQAGAGAGTTTDTATGESAEAALADALAALVGPALGAGSVAIEDLRRLSGGSSRETWAFDAVSPGGGPGGGARRRLILQRPRPGHLTDPTMAVEDVLVRAAERAGVPVAPLVVDVATATPLLGEARITGHVGGEALGSRLVRAQRSQVERVALVGQMGRSLAAIHSIEPGDVPGLAEIDPLQRLRDGLDLVGEVRPAFELALRWLTANRPPSSPPRVVHGDFRVGNLLIEGQELRAVLDWELAHLGDPLEDLGWLCVRSWRFGGDHEVGGIGDLRDLLAAYGEARGIAVDPEAVRWWIVVGTLTWGLICAVQARRHLDGHVRSVELATIGRRVCETEYDLLDLLGVKAATGTGGAGSSPGPGPSAGGAPGAPGGPADLHGRPTAVELVGAVRGHLVGLAAGRADATASFQTKVAANALAIVERELELGPAMAVAHGERLRSIGFSDEAALAAAIRAGDTGNTSDRPDVLAAIRVTVVDRLRVANPRWLVAPDAG